MRKILSVALLLMGLQSAAHATSTSITAETARDLSPYYNNIGAVCDWQSTIGMFTPAQFCAMALNVPIEPGKKLSRMTVHYYAWGVAPSINMRLTKIHLASTAYEVVWTGSPNAPDAFGNAASSTVSPVTMLAGNAYTLQVEVFPGTYFKGVTFEYQ